MPSLRWERQDMWSTLTSSLEHIWMSAGAWMSAGKHLLGVRKFQEAGREHEKAFTGALGYCYKADWKRPRLKRDIGKLKMRSSGR